MLKIGPFDFVELIFGRRVAIESSFLEEIAIIGRFFDDFKGHFENSVLEFDDEIDENLVAIFGDVKLLTDLPKFFGHPAGDGAHSF